jgi:hypothetical protein
VRAEKGLAFHREIQAAIESNSKDRNYIAKGYKICAIVGTYQDTLQSARLATDGLIMCNTHPKGDLGGDGTVPRVSAVPLEEGSQLRGRAVSARHAVLQNAEAALNQLEYSVTGLDVDDTAFKAITSEAEVGLALDDAWSAGDAVTCRLRCSDPSREVTASVLVSPGGQSVATRLMRPKDTGWMDLEFGPLPVGTYRLRAGGEGVREVEDVFMVLDPRA